MKLFNLKTYNTDYLDMNHNVRVATLLLKMETKKKKYGVSLKVPTLL